VTLLPMDNARIDVVGHTVMSRCKFYTVRALATTRTCSSCDALLGFDARPNAYPTSAAVSRWFYEIVVADTESVAQIGFAVPGFKPEEQAGVGDDMFSWAFDGQRKCKWHDPTPDDVNDNDGSETYGDNWSSGDTVGCLLEITPTGGAIRFYLNGKGMGKAFDLSQDDLSHGPFFPAATMVDGVWRFHFDMEELSYPPPFDFHTFEQPTRTAAIAPGSHSRAALGSFGRDATLFGGCSSIRMGALDYHSGQHLALKMFRAGADAHHVCTSQLAAKCDQQTEDAVMWIVTGSALTVLLLTVSTVISGERRRRRRQFQLLGLGGEALRLDQNSIARVLPDEEARIRFRNGFDDLQRMLQAFGRHGMIDLNISRATLLRDIVVAFADREDLQDSSNLRCNGLRIRFEGEAGIDEGGLRREFYSQIFRALVDADAQALAAPATEDLEPEPEPESESEPGHELTLSTGLLRPDPTGTAAQPSSPSVEPAGCTLPPLFTATVDGTIFTVAKPATIAPAADVSRPCPSWNRSILTEIYLPMSRLFLSEILRTETPGQDETAPPAPQPHPNAPTRFGTQLGELARSLRSRTPFVAAQARVAPVEMRMVEIGELSETSLSLEPQEPELPLEATVQQVQILRRPRRRRLHSFRAWSRRGVRRVERALRAERDGRGSVSRAFSSWKRCNLTEIYLCHVTTLLITKLRMETPGQASALGAALLRAEPLSLYRLCGLFLAKAIIDDHRVDVVFARSFYASLLQQPLDLDQQLELLQEVDSALHASLKWLLDNDLSEGGERAVSILESVHID
jgi:hypothetical protein